MAICDVDDGPPFTFEYVRTLTPDTDYETDGRYDDRRPQAVAPRAAPRLALRTRQAHRPLCLLWVGAPPWALRIELSMIRNIAGAPRVEPSTVCHPHEVSLQPCLTQPLPASRFSSSSP